MKRASLNLLILVNVSILCASIFTIYRSAATLEKRKTVVRNNANDIVLLHRDPNILIGEVYANSDLDAIIPIKNDFSTPLQITSIRGSCGCIVVSTNVSYLNINDVAKMAVHIHFGDTLGVFEHSIVLSIGALSPKVIIVKARIVDAVEIQPRILIWHAGDPIRSKDVCIRSRVGSITAINELAVSNQNFSVNVTKSRDGSAFILCVTPSTLYKGPATSLTWYVTLSSGQRVTCRVYAFVE